MSAAGGPPGSGPGAAPGGAFADRHATLLFAAVLLVSLALRVASLGSVAYALGADEGYYLRYARAVAADGPAALRPLVDEYLRHGNGMSPPATRAGFILPAALWLRLAGDGSPETLSLFSTLFFAATVVAAFAFLRRHVRPALACLAASLLAFSPLAAGLARRILQDEVVLFLTIACLALFHEALAAQRRRAVPAAAFGVALAWLLLTKETALLTLVVLAAWALVWKYRGDAAADLHPLWLATAAALALAGAAYLYLCGGAAGLATLVGFLLFSPAANPYAVAHQSGPWFRYVVDLVSVSPFAVLLAAGYAFHRLVSRPGAPARSPASDPPDSAVAGGRPAARPLGVADFLLFYLALSLALHAQLTKNLRYILPLEFPLRFLAAAAIVGLVEARATRHAAWAGAAFSLFLLAYDTFLFDRIFLTGAVYDPVTDGVLRALGILP